MCERDMGGSRPGYYTKDNAREDKMTLVPMLACSFPQMSSSAASNSAETSCIYSHSRLFQEGRGRLPDKSRYGTLDTKKNGTSLERLTVLAARGPQYLRFSARTTAVLNAQVPLTKV